MNKLFYVLLMSVMLQNVVISQKTLSTLNIEKNLKKYFSKVQSTEFVNLVPFFDKEKWGYLNKNSKRKIVPAIFSDLSYVNFFNPDIYIIHKDAEIEIKSSGEIIVTQNREVNEMVIEKSNETNHTKVRTSKDGFKGFTLTDNGELSEYSDLYEYNKQGIPGWNIQVFKYKNQHYGIVSNLNGEYGIIDSVGIPMKGFEFNYNKILINRKTADTSNVWFFIMKNKNDKKYSLINTNGVIKCENEIFTYPLVASKIFGITAFHDNNISGIFDSYNMKWIVKPQAKINIGELFYSSKKILNTDDETQRDSANIYYLVTEKKIKYFADLNGNKYISTK